MAQVSFDGQSLALDGRRLWLVSGELDFTSAPAGRWPSLLRTARHAGLNAIATRVCWHDHEAAPGRFDFTGDLDLRRFVELAAAEGLWVILRPGPSVGAGRDLGGIPPHVQRAKTDRRSGPMKVRAASPPFLEGVARFFRAMMAQVEDLQVTKPAANPTTRSGGVNPSGLPAGGFHGQGAGPVVLFQAEHRWHAHSPRDHDGYLRQVVRYLQECGAQAPIVVANNLWQPVEGTIAGWHGRDGLSANLRQLGVVQPEAPRFLMECEVGAEATVGEPLHEVESPEALQRRLVGVLSSGTQFNLDPFFAGTKFGHAPGRRAGGVDRFATVAGVHGAPLDDAGEPTPWLAPVRRVASFASQFAPLLAALETNRPRVVLSPSSPSPGLSVVHEPGPLGDLVTLTRDDKHRGDAARILLPTGLELDIPLGDERSAWTVLDARLGASRTLDYCAFRPLAFVDDALLVVYGPAGMTGAVGIEGEHVTLTAPTGKTPVVERMQGVTVVLLSRAQADAFVLDNQGLVLNAVTTDDQGDPVAAQAGGVKRIAIDGEAKAVRVRKPASAEAPALSPWSIARLDDVWDGAHPGFKTLERADVLELAGKTPVSARGYAALRFELTQALSGKAAAPGGGVRLHVFSKGQRKAILGPGPDASLEPAAIRASAGAAVVLADSAGRWDDGSDQGADTLGLGAGLRGCTPVRLAKPKVEASRKPDPYALPGYHAGAREGEVGPAERLVWNLTASAGKDLWLRVLGLPCRAVLTLNDQPLAYLGGPASGGHTERVLSPEKEGLLRPGKNTLGLELFETVAQTGRTAAQLAACVGVLTLKPATHDPAAVAHLALDAAPEEDAFVAIAKNAKPDDAPAWFAATFDTPAGAAPVYLEPAGMTRGLIELNGRLVCRYQHAPADGKALGPQKRYLLPRDWMTTPGEPNRLCLFDEHGHNPKRVALSLHDRGAYA
ncbi:MAG: beta-galactosidase [Planctomycetota bacterium]